MADNNKYVAYISSYTRQNDKGIRIFDVDIKKGRIKEREEISITNSSYMTISHNGKHLYSITDTGVQAFEILENGDLKPINKISINGMRGCYLSPDYTDKFLFVAGYHDGKITVLKLNSKGGLSEITDEIYLKGMGSIAERNFRPHVSCVKMTRDNKYLCACAIGIDHVNIYELDHKKGTLKLADIVRCEQESGPKYIKFRKDGKFAYIVHELNNSIVVYEYSEVNGQPMFNKIQKISTLNDYHAGGSAACAVEFSPDHKYLFTSNAGDNSVGAFLIDQKTGMLSKRFVLPISGEYPKDIACFPDCKHLMSINHESDTVTFFNLNLKDNTIVMNGPEIKVPKGNCAVIMKLSGEEAKA
ncbi:MAG: lactonase family protein [Lachnospiraceae bacterium]|nr:lactonase family protein [Lachnospiraceae bacterium]